MKPLNYFLATRRTPLVEKTVEILNRTLRERSGVSITEVPEARAARLVLDIRPGIGREGFRIEWVDDQTRITGNDERGLLYGIGKFLRTSRFAEGAFTPGPWTGTSVPAKTVRGMYFATHFHNFYHVAPLGDVVRYIEELALWGCNALLVWFDMHHYTGIADPAAQQMIERLKAILRAARSVGMGAAMGGIANEAYSTSPVELRAEPYPSHYHVEICPSRPGGLELIIRWREEMLERFAELDLEYFTICPYDQGGCRCPACRPWGANGFLRTAAAIVPGVRRVFPRVKTVIFTWCIGYFEGEGEWDAFYAAMAERPAWADCIIADHHDGYPPYVLRHGSPGGLPLLNFPEISMFQTMPWGGFGANPAPTRFQNLWNQSGHLLAGGFPYSEGIFEDINKAICLQLYWEPSRPTWDTVREYVGYEFSPDAVEQLTEATQLIEQGRRHAIRLEDGIRRVTGGVAPGEPLVGMLKTVPTGNPSRPTINEFQLRRDDALESVHNERAARCYALVQEAEQKLPAPARQAWRWRLLAIRAALDQELARSGGAPTDRTESLFLELERLYHAHQARWNISVPTTANLRRLSRLTGDPRR